MKRYILKILYVFLATCCRFYVWRTHPLIIGITGSVGKTSCRMVLDHVLQKTLLEKQIYTSPKNYNSELGLAFSLFAIESYIPSIKNLFVLTGKIFFISLLGKKKYDIFVLEYGIDHPGDMDILLSYVVPDYAIFTKLDFTHSDNFPGGKQQVGQEKWRLMMAAKKAIFYNQEDIFLQKQAHIFLGEKHSFFTGDIEVQEGGIIKQEEKILSVFRYKNIHFSTNLIGRENGVYIALGLFLSREISGEMTHKDSYDFSDILLQPGRFTLFLSGENILVDSTYNASPDSMKIIIENTKNLQKTAFLGYRLGFVLGDMREIGDAGESAHKNIASQLQGASFIFTIGPSMRDVLTPTLKDTSFSGDIFSSLSARDVGKYLEKYLEERKDEKYIILFKGSQNTIFVEDALAPLLSETQKKDIARMSPDWIQKKDDFFQDMS